MHHSNHNTHARVLNGNADNLGSALTPFHNVEDNSKIQGFPTTLRDARQLQQEDVHALLVDAIGESWRRTQTVHEKIGQFCKAIGVTILPWYE